MTQAYGWWPTETAPREAPVFLVNGDLQLLDGGTTYVPDKRVAGKGWGASGSLDIVGEKEKALPARVSLTWFSFLEDRFYRGEFALPAAKLEQLFAQGAPAPPPRKRQGYDQIIFGMAPGGNVSVWLQAGQVVTEVATFRAQIADVPFSEVLDTTNMSREQYIQQTLGEQLTPAQITELRSPERLMAWNDYIRRLPWTPQLAGARPERAILWIKGLNGERNWADLADPTRGGEPLPAQLPMPASLTLAWQGADGRLSAEIVMDPVEVVAAFKKLAGADRPGPMTLMLEPSGTGDTVDVFLRRGELAYRFNNNKVEVFGSN